MVGRSFGRRPPPRRRTLTATGSSSTTISAVRLIVVTLGLCSVLYLVSTHTMLSPREEHGGPSHVRGNAGFQSFGKTNGEDDGYDPRAISQRNPDEPRDVELVCDGGKPPVDLSYWKDIPRDKRYESPWGKSARKSVEDGYRQYVTFEPDHGGFNNIRMQMETVLVFALATERTLVMPPAQKFYLLKTPASEFGDMFPVEAFADYMDVMSSEEFLKKEGVTGRLGKLPPGGRSSEHSKEQLQDYLREVADSVPHWDHMRQALVFGPSPDQPDVPNDDDSQRWLSQFLTEKRTQLSYTGEMQKARLIHFRTSSVSQSPPTQDEMNPEYRLFTHFYTFVGFSDPVAARHHRRVVRDAVHFRESLFCVSSRIVDRLRKAGKGDPGRWSGWHGEGGGIGGSGGWTVDFAAEMGVGVRKAGFSTFHIRRGDFQYIKMKPPASTIVEATKDIRIRGEVLYIATDERDKKFFADFERDHRVFFLDDFADLLKDIDPTYYLMIDTIVASQGRAFIGTWRSTFTGYITRLRGYYNYPTEFSWYFWNESKRDYEALSLAADPVPRTPFFMREWPNAWENIDKGTIQYSSPI